MNKYYATATVFGVVTLALMISVFIPMSADAVDSQSNFSSGSMSSSASQTMMECEIWSNVDEVENGGSASVFWSTEGVTELTLNDEPVTEFSGSRAFLDIQENKSFILIGKNDSGGSCQSEVKIDCLPPILPPILPPASCELEVAKSVDAYDAIIGDKLAYTITVTNTGDANCTGGGVKIVDPIDSNVDYISHELIGDVDGGYGSHSVHSNNTLYFNAHTLVPDESVTIKWVGEVTKPNQCGDFTVVNQAKATAKELDNFSTWAYSNTVSTEVDYDCHVQICDAANVSATKINETDTNFTVSFTNDNDCEFAVGGTSYEIPVDNGQLCTWQNGKLDCQVRYAYKDITLAPYETREVTVAKPEQCYQYDWYYGVSVEKLDPAFYGNPVLSYVLNEDPYEDRLYGAVVDPLLSVERCSQPEPLSCELFATDVTGPVEPGTEVTLSWETINASSAGINEGIGQIPSEKLPDGSMSYIVQSDKSFVMTIENDAGRSTQCTLDIEVAEPEEVSCSLTADPSNFGVNGGDVTLEWEVSNADSYEFTPTSLVGTVSESGTKTVFVDDDTDFLLTATKGSKTVSCPAAVTVDEPNDPFTCSNNVDFSATDYSIDEGDDTTLVWEVTGADSISITDINNPSFADSKKVSPSSDRTYTLKATKDSKTISCPLTIAVDEDNGGGGGGGSASPRCELEISDDKIEIGETIEITWDTRSTKEVTLTDDEGEIIFTTDEYLARDKKEYLDYSIKLKPTRDTEYTLVAENGRKDDECTVDVEVEGEEVVVIESRDQQPLVAGIALSQVPYTGFEAGPVLTLVFYLLLVVWALFLTYLLVLRNRSAVSNGSFGTPINFEPRITEYASDADHSEPTDQATTFSTIAPAPTNLPTGNTISDDGVFTPAAVVAESASAAPAMPVAVDDESATQIENRAHEQHALLSSDAIRFFISSTKEAARLQELDAVIKEAKKTYPLEDGWIVLNELRMKNLCEECRVETPVEEKPQSFVPTVLPSGTSSLAEAIVTGNVVAAYEMIGNRPMFALADASADLDAVYRLRKGGTAKVSDLLLKETERLSDEQLQTAINALTSALDGTYTDEAAAVKIAIMKAVKAVA